MILEQKWKMISVILLVGVVSFLYTTKQPICPHDFKDLDAKIVAFQAWGEDFYDKNPDASISEFFQARHQFLVDNNCTVALQRYNRYKIGNLSPEEIETLAFIKSVIEEYISTSTSSYER